VQNNTEDREMGNISFVIQCSGCKDDLGHGSPKVTTHQNTDSSIGIVVAPCEGCIKKQVDKQVKFELSNIAKQILEGDCKP